MAAPTFDRDRALRILLDAIDMGDAKACERHKITARTLQNYRKRLADDPELSQAFALKKAELDNGWKRERLEALRAGIKKMGELFKVATIDHLRDVTGGVKVLGELQVALEVLDDDADVDRSGPEPQEAEGSSPGGEGPPLH